MLSTAALSTYRTVKRSGDITWALDDQRCDGSYYSTRGGALECVKATILEHPCG